MKIALDLDGVLADLQDAMIAETEYTERDFEQWAKPNYNFFLSEASRVWSEHWNDIEPVDENVAEHVEHIREDHTVDIVTNTAGPNEYVEMWLNEHSIGYNDIVRPYVVGGDKHDLEYDAYVDDKPDLAGRVNLLYLRDRSWNQSIRGMNGPSQYLYHSYEDSYVDGEGYPNGHFDSTVPYVVRITGLEDVVDDLKRQ
jgi:hypothetical protein